MKGKKQLLWINLPNHQASFSIWGEGESERYIYCQGKTLISIHWASVSIKPTTFSEHFSYLNVFTYNNTITILFFWPLSLSLFLTAISSQIQNDCGIDFFFISVGWRGENTQRRKLFTFYKIYLFAGAERFFLFFHIFFFFCYFRGYREFKV